MGDTSVTGGPFSVALSGGSLPTIMALRNNYSQDQLETIRKWYQQQATKQQLTSIYLPSRHWYWADERCVPLNDADSNYFAFTSFFATLGASACIHELID